MKVIVSAGGTGGHLYPALALVDYIKSVDSTSEFLFVGTTDRLESEVVPTMGYAYEGLYVKGFVGNPIQKGINVCIFLKSLFKSKKILKRFNPDIVIGFGGYPSASIVLAASKLGYKTMIHEQNSIIGLTNKILIKSVDEIICCYKMAYDQFPTNKTKLLGNPRASVVSSSNLRNIHDLYGIDEDRKTVVIVMGSLGSATVNATMKQAISSFKDIDYDIIYVTGKNHYKDFMDSVSDIPEHVHIKQYIDDMPSLISSCDLLVTRAGATTLAEITALGCASLIIPSPYVVKNHQEYNGQELVNEDAAEMILEKDVTSEVFVDKINTLIHDDEKLKTLRNNAKALGKPNATKDIYEEIVKLVG